MKYRALIAFDVFFDTVGDPDVIINKLLDRLGAVDTEDLNLTWDNIISERLQTWNTIEDN